MTERIRRTKGHLNFPFSQSVEAGGMLFLSGRVSMTDSGEPLRGTVASQTRTVMTSIGTALRLAGLDFDSIVKVNVWLSDMKHFAEFNHEYSTFFRNGFPARSVVGAMLAFDLDVEIEVQALLSNPTPRLPPLHLETPLVESLSLSRSSGRSVWLKLESLQPSGSFKTRGIGHACSIHHSEGAKNFVSSSGGNAGLAVAYAGRVLGVPVTVVVPETTSTRAKDLLRLEGASVIVKGDSWQEANEFAQSLVDADSAFIHPFDDPLLWTGHSTMVDEIARGGAKPDAIVLSVGGGGLLCGVVEGLQRNGWTDVPILAVETEGTASFHEATKVGHPVELPRVSGAATSLGAKRVCEQALVWSRIHPVKSVVVSDERALSACESFLNDHRILVEPACGASLSVVYDGHPSLEAYSRVLVVVCGGATATIDQIRNWKP